MNDAPEPNPNHEPADSGMHASDDDQQHKKVSGRDISERGASDEAPSLMAEFCDKFPGRPPRFLAPYAPHVVFMTRLVGSRATANFLTQKFKRKFSRRSVDDIIYKVRQGVTVITREQLASVAREHPLAKQYAESNPDVLDPATAVGKPARRIIAKVTTDEAGEKPTVKKTAKAKKVPAKKRARKSGKAAKQVAKKKTGRLPRDPGPELPGLDSPNT